MEQTQSARDCKSLKSLEVKRRELLRAVKTEKCPVLDLRSTVYLVN